MNRRLFLRSLGFGTVAAAAAANGLIDVERLLWVPGEKTIILPALYRLGPHVSPLRAKVSVWNYHNMNVREYWRTLVPCGDGLYRVELDPIEGATGFVNIDTSWIEY